MAFTVPAPAGTDPANRFEFAIGDGEYSVPKMEYLTGLQAEALSKINTGEMDMAAMVAAWSIFDAEGDEVAAAVRGLEIAQLAALLEAWVAESQVTPGESERSPS